MVRRAKEKLHPRGNESGQVIRPTDHGWSSIGHAVEGGAR
jgi:hypothetical protein